MSTVQVIKTKILHIKTDKGLLNFPISYIDAPIIEGDYISVSKTTTGKDWRPYNDVCSVLAVKSTPFRACAFTSKNGNLVGSIKNSSNNVYEFTIKFMKNGKLDSATTSYDLGESNFILVPSYTLVMGNNNVAAFLGGRSNVLTIMRDSSIDPGTYKMPSDYGFGEFTRKAFNGIASSEIDKESLAIAESILGDSDYTPPDPYNNGGNTTNNGGGGTFGGGNTIFGGASDSIDIPPLPTASASSAGFITLFNPSLSQLNNLANYMWSDLFSLDTFKKIFADPMDCILGLSIVPVKPASAGTSTVKIGNVSTDVSMNKTSSQYVSVDCGTIDVKEYWGAYLDYAPYTQCEIYLPYVGTKQISVDDVMNKAVHVVYHVDILSGACNAYVKCGNSVLYTFVGQCSSSIPISGNDWTNVLNGAISVAGKIGLAMATGGATALMSGLGAASSIISSSKPTVERSGAMSSTGGLLGIQKPYLILTRPKQALPENQNKYTGYPSFITMALSDCVGYTEIDSVHLENMSCTDEEAQEIENLLKSGVIF